MCVFKNHAFIYFLRPPSWSGTATDIKSIQNVPKDLLGQAGKGIGILELLWFDSCRCKLGLDEAEPNVRFLLIVGTKFNLSSCCCSDRGVQIFTSRVCRFVKSWQCPKTCWALVPRRAKKIGSHCGGKEWVNWRRCDKFGTEKKSLGWNETHTKMWEQTGLNCATNNEKTESNKKRVQSRALW